MRSRDAKFCVSTSVFCVSTSVLPVALVVSEEPLVLLMIIIPCTWFGITTNTSKIFMYFMLFMVNLYENRFTFWLRFIRVGFFSECIYINFADLCALLQPSDIIAITLVINRNRARKNQNQFSIIKIVLQPL